MWNMTRIAAVPASVVRVALALVVAAMLVLTLAGAFSGDGSAVATGVLGDDADKWCVWAAIDSAPVVGSVHQEACAPSP